MTKTHAVSFAQAQAFKDVRFGRTAGQAEIEEGLRGYTHCERFFGLDPGTLRRQSVEAAIEAYRIEHGLLFTMPSIEPVARTRRTRRATQQSEAVQLKLRRRWNLRKPKTDSPSQPFGWCGQLL